MDTLPHGQRDVAMAFKSYALYPHMTVAQNKAFLFHEPLSNLDAALRGRVTLDCIQDVSSFLPDGAVNSTLLQAIIIRRSRQVVWHPARVRCRYRHAPQVRSSSASQLPCAIFASAASS